MSNLLRSWGHAEGEKLQFAALQQAALVRALYFDNRPNFDELVAGLGGGAVVYYDAPLHTLPPQTAVISQDGDYWIVIAGTTNWRQWVGNVAGSFGTEYPLQNDVFANTFFLAESERLWIALDGIVPKSGGTHRVYVSGHSLGGAVAFLLGNRFANALGDPERVQVITFGQPKALGFGYDGVTPGAYARLCHPSDMVPYVPPAALLLWLARRGLHWTHLLGRTWPQHYGQRFKLADNRDARFEDSIENLPFELTFPKATDYLRAHSMDTYLANLVSHYLPSEFHPAPVGDDLALVNLALGQLGKGPLPAPPDLPLPSTITTASELDRIVSGGKGFITGANLDDLRLASAYGAGFRDPMRNIGELSPGVHMPDPQIFKVTFHINNPRYGRSFSSYCVPGTSNPLGAAMTKGRALAGAYSILMGNGFQQAADSIKSMHCPHIDYISIADAKFPRKGTSVPLPTDLGLFFGGVGGDGWAADVLSTSLSVRMPAGVPNAASTHANLIITGQPDDVVLGGEYRGKEKLVPPSVGATGSYDLLLKNFFLYLVSNGWGTFGRDQSVPDKDVEEFDLVDTGFLLLTITGHGFSSGDTIVLKSCDNSDFNQTAHIKWVSANQIALTKHKYATGTALPTRGKVYRTKLASGERLGVFMPYYTPVEGWQDPLQVQVRFKKPGRPFLPGSFSKKKGKGN